MNTLDIRINQQQLRELANAIQDAKTIEDISDVSDTLEYLLANLTKLNDYADTKFEQIVIDNLMEETKSNGLTAAQQLANNFKQAMNLVFLNCKETLQQMSEDLCKYK